MLFSKLLAPVLAASFVAALPVAESPSAAGLSLSKRQDPEDGPNCRYVFRPLNSDSDAIGLNLIAEFNYLVILSLLRESGANSAFGSGTNFLATNGDGSFSASNAVSLEGVSDEAIAELVTTFIGREMTSFTGTAWKFEFAGCDPLSKAKAKDNFTGKVTL